MKENNMLHQQRIDALRQIMAGKSLDALIITHDDEYLLSELTPECERIKYICGFSGSAGYVVITRGLPEEQFTKGLALGSDPASTTLIHRSCALFVDGRYEIQAREQTEPELFDVFVFKNVPLPKWISRVLPRGARTGIDTRCLGCEEYERLELALSASGISLVDTAGNLVDRIWTDRPQIVCSKAAIFPDEYSGCSAKDKRRKLAQILQERNFDAAVICEPETICWLLNIRGRDRRSLPVVCSRLIALAGDNLEWYLDPAHLDPKHQDEMLSHTGPLKICPESSFDAALERLGQAGASVCADPSRVNAHVFLKLRQSGASITDGTGLCQLPKAVKNQTELEGEERAHLRDGAALCRFFCWLDSLTRLKAEVPQAPQPQVPEQDAPAAESDAQQEPDTQDAPAEAPKTGKLQTETEKLKNEEPKTPEPAFEVLKAQELKAPAPAAPLPGETVSAGAALKAGKTAALQPQPQSQAWAQKSPAAKPQAASSAAPEADDTTNTAPEPSLPLYVADDDFPLRAKTQSESTLAAVLEEKRKQGDRYLCPSFDTISALGPNAAMCHYNYLESSRPRILGEDSLYLVDSGAHYFDGTTDVTRTVLAGPLTDPALALEIRKMYTLVLKGLIQFASLIFPEGTCGLQLDAVARRPLWDIGCDYAHGTGHGVGHVLAVHEGPQAISTRNASVPLLPGMVISDEPGYYKEGAYGIRLENLLVVNRCTRPGMQQMLCFRTLTLAPFDLRLIEPALLSAAEIEWLNRYHQKVKELISERLTPEERSWLENATRPLQEPA